MELRMMKIEDEIEAQTRIQRIDLRMLQQK